MLKLGRQYLPQGDLVRVLAIMGVVGIHVLTPIYARPDFFGGGLWWLAFLANCLLRTSVPLFMMLSGYFVLAKEMSWPENLERLWKRILTPLIFFYLLVSGYFYLAATLRSEPFEPSSVLVNIARNTHTWLYFLSVLAYLYLLVPLWQQMFNSGKKWLATYVMTALFVNAFVATGFLYVALREGEAFPTFTSWLLWAGYFLFGYWFRVRKPVIKRDLLIMGFLIGYLITAITGYLSLRAHFLGNDLLYIGGQTYPEEYLSVNVALMSITIFMLLMRHEVGLMISQSPIVLRTVKWLAGVSFGVYLIHPIVLDVINKFFGVTADSPSMPNLWAYVLINGSIGLMASLILTVIIKRLPIRWIIGEK